jgi:hypothetical protein
MRTFPNQCFAHHRLNQLPSAKAGKLPEATVAFCRDVRFGQGVEQIDGTVTSRITAARLRFLPMR